MDSTGRRDRTLRGIAVLLIALAVVAENVSSRYWPVRFLTLLILRRAEAFAWSLVADMTCNLPPILDVEPESGNGPDNALELALRFRVLAAILQQLFWLECRFDSWSGSIEDTIRLLAHFATARASAFDNPAVAPFDTS
jgi:hypothetical protein